MLRRKMRSAAKDVHAFLEAHVDIYAARSACVPTFGQTSTPIPEVVQQQQPQVRFTAAAGGWVEAAVPQLFHSGACTRARIAPGPGT